jgi:peroxin-5
LNIDATKEAAEHFLSALSMQESSAGDKSEQLWFTLRRTFEAMVSDIATLRHFRL